MGSSTMAMGSDSFRLLAGDILKKMEYTRDMLAIVGLVCVGKVAVDTSIALLSALRIFLLSKLHSVEGMKKKYGPWAIVTGATDGIGKEYARQLARSGINIILMSRSLDKLTRVAQEIEAEFNVETQVVQVDFSAGRSVFDKISESIQGKEIGILVNNVGVMCWLVLPQMLQRRKGAIINISSSSSLGPLPYMN